MMNKFLYGLVALTAIVLAGCGEQMRIRDDFRFDSVVFCRPSFGVSLHAFMGMERNSDGKNVKKGVNTVELSVAPMSIFAEIEPVYRNPVSGLASPWNWKYITEQMPGVKYQMLDYGLMEDFSLIVNIN